MSISYTQYRSPISLRSNSSNLAYAFKAKANRLSNDLEDIVVHVAITFRQYAYLNSSGTYTLEELAAMGHPYGRGKTPPDDPRIINAQSGRFRNGWEIDRWRKTRSSATWSVHNSAMATQNSGGQIFYRDIIGATGTIRMQPRNIVQKVIEDSEQEINNILESGGNLLASLRDIPTTRGGKVL